MLKINFQNNTMSESQNNDIKTPQLPTINHHYSFSSEHLNLSKESDSKYPIITINQANESLLSLKSLHLNNTRILSFGANHTEPVSPVQIKPIKPLENKFAIESPLINATIPFFNSEIDAKNVASKKQDALFKQTSIGSNRLGNRDVSSAEFDNETAIKLAEKERLDPIDLITTPSIENQNRTSGTSLTRPQGTNSTIRMSIPEMKGRLINFPKKDQNSKNSIFLKKEGVTPKSHFMSRVHFVDLQEPKKQTEYKNEINESLENIQSRKSDEVEGGSDSDTSYDLDHIYTEEMKAKRILKKQTTRNMRMTMASGLGTEKQRIKVINEDQNGSKQREMYVTFGFLVFFVWVVFYHVFIWEEPKFDNYF